MKAHPIAELFPLLEGAAFDALVADIKEHGQREPIVIFDEKILDGRNRYRACKMAKVEPKTRQHRGDEKSALAFVVSLNLHRRHLDESQRAMAAGRIANMRQGQKKSDASIDASARSTSQAEAADLCNVGRGSVQRAAKVLTAHDQGLAPSELIHAVDAGQLPVSGAASIVALPLEDQKSIVAKVVGGDAKNVAQAKRQLASEKRAAVPAPKIVTARVLCGDAVSLARALDVRPDLVVTDPPYGLETHRMREGGKDYADGADYAPELLRNVFAELAPKLADNAHIYVFSGYSYVQTFKEILREFFDVQDNPLVWVKDNHTPCDFAKWYPSKHEYILFAKKRGGGRSLAACVADVLTFRRETGAGHSAQKPVDLLSLLIEQSSVPGEIVIDPFCGSGSTAVAATTLKRAFVGFELDANYARIAEARIAEVAA